MRRCRLLIPAGRRIVASLLVVVTGVATQNSARAEVDLVAEATAGYTSNLLRVPDGESDVPVSLGLSGGWTESTRHLSADVSGRVSGVRYLDDTYDDEVLGQVDGTVTWWPVPEQFAWVLENSYGQISSDPFSPVGPANRQNTNYLSTGPDWFIPLGGRMRAYLGGRYGSVRYEETTVSNNERLMGILGMDRAVSSASRLGVQASTEAVDFDSELQPDFDRHAAYVRYEFSRGAEAELVVNAGYTWLSTDADDQSAPLLQVQLSRPLSASLTFRLELVSQFSDAGQSFAAEGSPDFGEGVDSIVLPEFGVFEERGGRAGIAFERARNTLTLGAGMFDEIYETDALDRRRYDVDFRVERRMNERTTGSASVVWSRNDFESDGTEREDTDTEYRLELRRQLGRRTSLALVGLHASRSSDDPATEFDETRGYLVLGYTLR